MKKAIGCFCCLCLIPALLLGLGELFDDGETGWLGVPEVLASPGDFFRDKFICARAVEGKAKDSRCLECHGAIIKEIDLITKEQKDPRQRAAASPVVVIHAQHMASGKVNFTCLTCHQRIDPYQTSSAGIRNQVPANMCFKCHFPHGKE